MLHTNYTVEAPVFFWWLELSSGSWYWPSLSDLILQEQKGREPPSEGASTGVMNDLHIRLIANGQELNSESDKKTLQQLQFKDNQVNTISTLLVARAME